MYSSLNFILVPPVLGPQKKGPRLSGREAPMPPRVPSAAGAWSDPSERSRRRLAPAQLRASLSDRDGEVDGLAAARDEDPDDVALAVERRAARVAGVGGGVRLDRASRHAADDARRDGAVEAVGAAEEQQLVACAWRAGSRRLPERSGAGRLRAHADQREVVLGVDGADLAAPRASLARDGHFAEQVTLDDVVGGQQVGAAAV